MIYMTFLGGVFGPFLQEKNRKQAQNTPQKKSYRSYFRRAQIRWVIWPSSNFFTLFRTFSHFFRNFPPGLSPSKQRVLAQGEQKRRKDNKKNGTNRYCMLVVARLSSSYQSITVGNPWVWLGAHQGGHAATRFVEGFLEGSLKGSAS